MIYPYEPPPITLTLSQVGNAWRWQIDVSGVRLSGKAANPQAAVLAAQEEWFLAHSILDQGIGPEEMAALAAGTRRPMLTESERAKW